MQEKRFVILLHGVMNEKTDDEMVAAAYVSTMKRIGWKDVKYTDRKEKGHVVC